MSEILFAEDDADIRKWVAVALETEGYAVRTVPDGEAALAAYAAQRPDLLMLDIMMPKRDGVSVCAEIRRRDAALPILMLTARTAERDKIAGLGAGADDYMTKPFGLGATALGGEAAFQYVKRVIELALAGEVDATVTNALSKEAINMAGHHFSGHTEIYAHYTNTDKYTMMLAHEDLRVVHVSTHVSLREACDRVKKPRVLEVIRIADAGCRALGIETPRVAVAGLNPHCGENGLFGTEEIEEIQPAIDAALAEGINIPEKKPTPPDTVFSKAIGDWYDIVVVMYHDQGHIPLKVKGFVYNREEKHWDAVAGVNVTLGLPIIRASVDHGTGFGHAGSGHANALSLVNAMAYAIRMANAKAK